VTDYGRYLAGGLILSLLVVTAAQAQSSPSIFTNPSINFGQIRRVAVVPFSVAQGVQDPFAGVKALSFLVQSLRTRGLQLVEFASIARRVQEDTGRQFSTPLSDEDLKVLLAELPKHTDALLVGHVSAWGVLSEDDTRLLPVPVYGWAPVPAVTGRFRGTSTSKSLVGAMSRS